MVQNSIVSRPHEFVEEFNFRRQADVTDLTITTTGAGSGAALANVQGGALRITTDANDNDRVEIQTDSAFVLMPAHMRMLFEAVFTTPATAAELVNQDIAIGLVTGGDTDWLGDAATATEILTLHHQAAGTPAAPVLRTKSAAGETTNSFGGAALVHNTRYIFRLMVDVSETAGTGSVEAMLIEDEAFRGNTDAAAVRKIAVPLTNLPTGLLALAVGSQNGSAKAVVFDVNRMAVGGPELGELIN